MANSLLQRNSKLFLYSGLTFLLIALIIRGFGGSTPVWVPVFGLAIILKATFLFVVVRSRKFKWSLWLTLILIGVIMIFISMIFKYILPIPLLRNILFYGALIFKVAGLVLIFTSKIKPSRQKDISE